MGFDAEKHHRRSIRLSQFDYSSPNAYFVTICSFRKECLFSDIVDGRVRLNETGAIIEDVWNQLPHRYPHIEIDSFVVMPNHVHGIIWIRNDDEYRMTHRVGAIHELPLRQIHPVGAPLVGAQPNDIPDDDRAGARPAPTLGDVVGAFKSITTVEYSRTQNARPKLWQRNYYDRVIRDDEELYSVRQYIHDNPKKWELDEYHQTRN